MMGSITNIATLGGVTLAFGVLGVGAGDLLTPDNPRTPPTAIVVEEVVLRTDNTITYNIGVLPNSAEMYWNAVIYTPEGHKLCAGGGKWTYTKVRPEPDSSRTVDWFVGDWCSEKGLENANGYEFIVSYEPVNAGEFSRTEYRGMVSEP